MAEAKGAVVFIIAYHRLGRLSTRPPTVSELGVMTSCSGLCSQTCSHTSQPVAAVVVRLGGAAREMVRGIAPQELAEGGAINGVQYDPVPYIVGGLQQ